MAQTDSYTYLKNTTTTTTFNNLSLGNTKVTPYLGNKKVKEVYLGSNKIYGVTNIAGGYRIDISFPNIYDNKQASLIVAEEFYPDIAYELNSTFVPFIDTNSGKIVSYLGQYYFEPIYDDDPDGDNFTVSNVAKEEYDNYYGYNPYIFSITVTALNTSHTCSFNLSYTEYNSTNTSGFLFNLKSPSKIGQTYVFSYDGYNYAGYKSSLLLHLNTLQYRKSASYIINCKPASNSVLPTTFQPVFTNTIRCNIICNGSRYTHNLPIEFWGCRYAFTPPQGNSIILTIFVGDRTHIFQENYPERSVYFRFISYIEYANGNIINNEKFEHTAKIGGCMEYYGTSFTILISKPEYDNLANNLHKYKLQYCFDSPFYSDRTWILSGTPQLWTEGLFFGCDFS
jgi:hypothetical protein